VGAAAIFAVDVTTPGELAPETLYGIVLLGSLWAGRPWVSLGLAAACTVFVGLGHIVYPAPVSLGVAVADRVFALLMIWVVTLLVLGVHGTLAQLRKREAAVRVALAAMEAAVADKETLLKEVHHRTKNNLQMVCTLLDLQAEAIQNPEGKDALEVSAQRIYAIARLHEQLYRTLASGKVALGAYLHGLAESFRATCGDTGITLHLPPPDGSMLDVDRAISCGLIVNELLTNAVKHAFARGAGGEIGIEVREEVAGQMCVRVWDNGRGLPADLDIERSVSLGLRLIHILARQLHATVSAESHGGTAFTLRFPAEAEE
jgi:two-component sensor histidine kinase